MNNFNNFSLFHLQNYNTWGSILSKKLEVLERILFNSFTFKVTYNVFAFSQL